MSSGGCSALVSGAEDEFQDLKSKIHKLPTLSFSPHCIEKILLFPLTFIVLLHARGSLASLPGHRPAFHRLLHSCMGEWEQG